MTRKKIKNIKVVPIKAVPRISIVIRKEKKIAMERNIKVPIEIKIVMVNAKIVIVNAKIVTNIVAVQRTKIELKKSILVIV